MEQLDMFSVELTEATIFELLRPHLLQVITDNNADPDLLILKKGKDYSSVWYDSQMAFRIYCRDKKHYFSVPTVRYEDASSEIKATNPKFDLKSGFQLLQFEPTQSGINMFSHYLAEVFDMTIDNIAKEFDCCSRFEDCSDAKRCLNPDHNLAIKCGYRKIMKSGRYFVGKNRNID